MKVHYIAEKYPTTDLGMLVVPFGTNIPPVTYIDVPSEDSIHVRQRGLIY